jgi:hypothetical protein
VTVGAVAPGSGSLHSDYIVEDGFDGQKALQLETVPVGKANLIAFTFSEAVDLTSATLALDGINGINYEAVFDAYDPTTFTGKWIVSPPLANTDPPDTGAPDQVEFTLSNVTDLGGVRLDGEWNNPDSTADSSVDTFPSGDGSADGMNDFVLRLNFITADFNQDNMIDGSDFGIWNSNKFTVPNPVEDGFLKGDANGDNAIDGSDFGIWNAYKFTLWTCWRGSSGTGCQQSAMGGGGGSSFLVPSAAWQEQYRRVVEFHNIFVNGQVNNSLSASDWERFTDAVMILLDQL